MSSTGALEMLLFVRGNTQVARAAVVLLRRVSELPGLGHCKLQVVDVFQEVELARSHGVLATPTLLLRRAGSERRLVGDLTEKSVLACLQLSGAHGVA